MCKGNSTCPSYDCGICITYPSMIDVKCSELTTCKWQNFDFTKTSFKEYMEQERAKDDKRKRSKKTK